MSRAAADILADALALAGRGYAVFPVLPGDKRPMTPRGFHDATADPDQICDWFTDRPDANLAIRTGELIVVDVDPDGLEGGWFADHRIDLETEAGAIVRTPRGGFHYYFAACGATIKNSVGKLAPGVDIRGAGGYVCCPPSIVGGAGYAWMAEPGPIGELPPVPAWLVDELLPPAPPPPRPAAPPAPRSAPPGPHNAYVAAAVKGELDRVAHAQNGTRNATLNAAAFALGTLVGAGELTYSEAEQALTTAGRHAGLPDGEIAATVRSGLTAGMRQPRQLPDRASERPAKTAPPNRLASVLEESDGDDTSDFVDVVDLVRAHPEYRPIIIDGVIRRGETACFSADRKIGKTHLIHGLAIAVATGTPWLGQYETRRGKVLIVDNEVHQQTLSRRFSAQFDKRGLDWDDVRGHLTLWPCRGKGVDLVDVYHRLTRPNAQRFDVVILDAWHRILPSDTDENSNGEIKDCMNLVDRLAARTGSAFVLVHHTSKGNQSEKTVTDVGAGASALSRCVDGHFVVRHHEEEGAAVLDAALRSFRQFTPVVLRLDYPVWRVDPTLDPTQLARGHKRKANEPPPPDRSPSTFVRSYVTAKPRTITTLAGLATADGWSRREIERAVALAVETGQAADTKVGRNRALTTDRQVQYV
jgi:hypothetical protein